MTVNRLVSRITSNSARGLDISWPQRMCMCTPCRRQSRSNASTSARSRLIIIGWVIITASWRPAVIASTRAAYWLPGSVAGPASA